MLSVTGDIVHIYVTFKSSSLYTLVISQCFAVSVKKATAPHVELANDNIALTVYLPDRVRGFYRGTRFDWSGVMASLRSQGHTFFDRWFSRVDPSIHDFSFEGSEIVAGACSGATGPVEEFTKPLGYDQAQPGGTFVKIGVGVLKKPDDAKYDSLRLYEIVDSGKWRVVKKKDSITFRQEIRNPSIRFAYRYWKTITLLHDRPAMRIDHTLTNIGTSPIETSVYDHNFVVIDTQPTGPDFSITFPFKIIPIHPPEGDLTEFRGNQIAYLKTLTGRDRVYTTMGGFGDSALDYNIRIENARLGAGITISGSQPLTNMALWSIRSVLAVEPFIAISVKPGQASTWTYEYTFHKLGSSAK